MTAKQVDLTLLSLSELQQLLHRVTQRIDELQRTTNTSPQNYAAESGYGSRVEPSTSTHPTPVPGNPEVETLSERVRGLSFANDACVGGYWSWSFALGTPFLVVAPVHKPDAAATPLPTFGGVHFESESSCPAESEQVKPTSGAARKVHRTHEARVVRHLLSSVRHG